MTDYDVVFSREKTRVDRTDFKDCAVFDQIRIDLSYKTFNFKLVTIKKNTNMVESL